MITHLLDVMAGLCSGWGEVFSEEFSTGAGSGVAGRPSVLCDNDGDFPCLGSSTTESWKQNTTRIINLMQKKPFPFN